MLTSIAVTCFKHVMCFHQSACSTNLDLNVTLDSPVEVFCDMSNLCNCNVPVPTNPLGFKPGLIAHSKSRASALTNSAKGSDLLISEKLAGRLGCHTPPFLNGSRHPVLVNCHSHQARNMLSDHQSALSDRTINACGQIPSVTFQHQQPHWVSNLGW